MDGVDRRVCLTSARRRKGHDFRVFVFPLLCFLFCFVSPPVFLPSLRVPLRYFLLSPPGPARLAACYGRLFPLVDDDFAAADVTLSGAAVRVTRLSGRLTLAPDRGVTVTVAVCVPLRPHALLSIHAGTTMLWKSCSCSRERAVCARLVWRQSHKPIVRLGGDWRTSEWKLVRA